MSLLEKVQQLQDALATQIFGQSVLLERLLIALLANGHLLVEGAPGLAKTKAIKALANQIEGDFQRIQFTPDLLPADITGTDIYRPHDGSFNFQPGPIFHNLILADEINRAPAKVQSALLEAMGEKSVSIGSKTHNLPELFLVMATQNPLEQEGTYPLPEAQLDRFLMHIKINHPTAEAEHHILQLSRQEAQQESAAEHHNNCQDAFPPLLNQQDIFAIQQQALNVYMAESVEEYLVQLVLATRDPKRYDDALAEQIAYGVSPRASIALDRCTRIQAWLQQRDFVTPEDIQQLAPDILRHRIGLNFSAAAKGITHDDVVKQLLEQVPAP